jgi:hypothetical protein
MNILNRRHAVGLIAVIFLIVAGCGGSGSGSGDKTGRISLGVSDDPVHEASKVCVAFNEVEFKSGSDSIIEDLADNVNLLQFQGNNAAPLLFNYELPAGDYQWMRLGVTANPMGNGGLGNDDTTLDCQGDESYIVTPDGVFNLYVPSGAKTGLKLVGGFTVPAGGSADFTAEFDLMKSVTAPDGLSPDVVLRPTIRLVNNVEVGTLTGEVSGDLATAIVRDPATETDVACAPSVYVFGDGVMPNPIDSDTVPADPDNPDAIATAMVNEQTDGTGVMSYHYTVGFLSAGEYEVAFTCDGTTFEPAQGKPAEIFAKELTTVDFP